MNSKPKRIILLSVILFEVYFIVTYIWSFALNGTPKVPFWMLIYLIKIVIGYIVYRLYISKRKHISMLGPLVIIVDIILTFVAYYAHLDRLSDLLIGGSLVLLAANTGFLYRYLKAPEIINAYFEGLTNFKKHPFGNAAYWYLSVLILGLVILNTAFGKVNSTMAWGVWFWWIGFYALIEGIIKSKYVSA